MDFRICLLLAIGVSASFYMNPVTKFFNDESGRSRLFHGVNAVVKIEPFIPITDHFDPQMSISAEDISNLVNWGFNFVRLGVMWEATETAPGVYNITYLNQINDLITTMGEAGIYTLVDAHQDVFARAICGEGMPNFWAQNLEHHCPGLTGWVTELVGLCTPLSKYHFQYDSDGNPLIADCLQHMFSDYYMSPEAMSAFDNLYSNKSGLLDHFFDHWTNVAQVMGENPYVVGYDLINEPLAANLYKNPLLALPGRFDRHVLQPLYEKLAATIRQYSDDKIIFFEPVQTDLLPVFGGYVYHAGFDATPGGEAYDSLNILNDHTYCCQASPSMCASGEPPLSDAKLCREFHEHRIGKRVEDAQRLGTGLIISEFGACTDSDACAAELTSVTEVCDSHLLSWAYWMFKGFGDYTTSGNLVEGFYDQYGDLQQNKLKALSRTYITAFQGVPRFMRFDNNTSDFAAGFVYDPVINAPTELYFNEDIYYPDGYTISVATLLGVQGTVQSTRSNYLEITFPGVTEAYEVYVTFTPAPYAEDHLRLPKADVMYTLAAQSGERSNFVEVVLKSTSLPASAHIQVSGEFGQVCTFTQSSKCRAQAHAFFKNVFSLQVDGEVIETFSIPHLNGGHMLELEVEIA